MPMELPWPAAYFSFRLLFFLGELFFLTPDVTRQDLHTWHFLKYGILNFNRFLTSDSCIKAIFSSQWKGLPCVGWYGVWWDS